MRGDSENRADAAATILRWLIGDDRVPVHTENPAELVDGFGDVVRSQDQIAAILVLASAGHEGATTSGRDVNADRTPGGALSRTATTSTGWRRRLPGSSASGPRAPITHSRPRELTTRDLKAERVHAEEVIEQARNTGMIGRLPPPSFGEGVKLTITWLLGASTTPPVDRAGRGHCTSAGELHAV